jgi:hypothetical protein
MKRSADEDIVDERPEKKARISVSSGEEVADANDKKEEDDVTIVPPPAIPPLPETEGPWWFTTHGTEVEGWLIHEWTPPSTEIAEMMHKACHAPNGRLWVSNLLEWMENGETWDVDNYPPSMCASFFPGKTREELGTLKTVVEWKEIPATLRTGKDYTLLYSLT